MADDRTEGIIVHLVDKHGGEEIEREYDDWEIVDEGWIRCIGPFHGGELDSGHVPVSYYPPNESSRSTFTRGSRESRPEVTTGKRYRSSAPSGSQAHARPRSCFVRR
jgi:hypothetical protein